MNVASLKLLTRRPPVIVASLVCGDRVGVSGRQPPGQPFSRTGEGSGPPSLRTWHGGAERGAAGTRSHSFRAALGYAHDNFDYQLSLARALRDTGRTAESETYLISLWERAPQEGAVNLALGRLFAREQLFDKAIQYYHNAIYGLWPGDPDAKRRDTEFELIALLLQHQAYPQAQAELITTAAALPDDPGLRIRVAQLFAQAQDYEHALAQFQQVLRADRDNQAALYGAGEAAFHLGRYRTAQGYLRSAVRRDPQNAQSAQSLKIATLVLDADPFAPRISDAERSRRGRSAFQAAGDRLDSCATSQGH